MKPYPLSLIKTLSLTLFLVIIVLQQFEQTVGFDNGGNQTDHTALLAIKSQLIDGPEGVLSSWNHSVPHCFWEGVTCGHKHNRVIKLQLIAKGLGGNLSPFIGNLSFLRNIVLSNNSLRGEIPQEIGRLFRLRSLKLHNNTLIGEIPTNISGCINLEILSVGVNKLQGELPMELGTLSNLKLLSFYSNKLSGPLFKVISNLTALEFIYAHNNSFTGTIPDSISLMRNLTILAIGFNQLSGVIPPTISNISFLEDLFVTKNNLEGELPMELGALHSLKILLLEDNQFSGHLFKVIGNLTSLQSIQCYFNTFTGSIPNSISKMTNLSVLNLAENKISGEIPSSIFNLSSLQVLDLGGNQLKGSIPSNPPFTLSQLTLLILSQNYFSGPLPNILLNFTNLQLIELDFNRFTGKIQHNFGKLYNLERLQIDYNYFVGDLSIIDSLVNCSQLEELDLNMNQFTGIIPKTLTNLSTKLIDLNIGRNPISGEFPLGITNLVNLKFLNMEESGLTGTIPHDFGKLQKLEWLYINFNSLKGGIPDSFRNMSLLTHLFLHDNKMEGRIPPSLGNCTSLLFVDLSNNNFNGSLPFELFGGFATFIYLYVSSNQFEGSLPLEISKQFQLVAFDVSENKLSGKIPQEFGDLVSLQYKDMHDNFFHGSIPPSFTALKSLLKVDLSRNNLSGPIPEYLANFSLMYLNLSYNNFEGRVPTKGVFANTSAVSLVGNFRLCGGIPELHLPRCADKERHHNRMLRFGVPTICALVGTLAMATCIWLYLTAHSKKRKQLQSSALVKESFMEVSYDTLLKATDGFSTENLVGSGCFGSVFKGILEGNTIAVKVFNLEIRGGSKSFIAECEALRKIRHRNLVGIITACSSLDYQRNEFKALVYEFMSNGNLDAWLHEGHQELSLLQRLDVAIDVAHALNYLHKDCGYPMVHCDLKPSNILLDQDLVAHVGDFGLVKVLNQPLHLYQSSSIGVKGTIGYIAPEYGLGGEASIEADIYSYGIVLLELITRKRPTDSMFKEDFNLHMYAKAALPDQVLHIMDSTLLGSEGEVAENEGLRIKPVLQIVVKIGVQCSNSLPNQRMAISAAINELQKARDILLKIQPNI